MTKAQLLARRATMATVALACVFSSAAHSFPAKNGRLAFGASIGGSGLQFAVFTVNPNGSGLVRLTHAKGKTSGPDDAESGDRPAWSADGKRIAYLTMRQSVPYVMNSDGSGKRKVAVTVTDGQGPRWSPDGKSIVVGFGVRIVKVDPPYQVRQLVSWKTASYSDWTPDGNLIAFMANGPSASTPNDEDCAIYLVNTSGTPHIRRLTPLRKNVCYGNPRWSPDGKQILYYKTTYNPKLSRVRSALYVMGRKGGSQRKVASKFGSYYTWSPDGRKIAYVRTESGLGDVVFTIVNVRGRTQTPVTVRGLASAIGDGIDWGPLR
jgi:Tol biopolymer transport system component